MYSTPEIESIIKKAKQQRAEHIASALQVRMLPFALLALVSFGALVLAAGNSEEQAQPDAVSHITVQNG
ncbi:MAG: hypothetical protein WBG86_06505 [Polyangiales bacterium]